MVVWPGGTNRECNFMSMLRPMGGELRGNLDISSGEQEEKNKFTFKSGPGPRVAPKMDLRTSCGSAGAKKI